MSLPPRLLKFCLRSGRVATATAALLAYLVTVVGVPLPMAPEKDRSQPFPCMDRPCGCKNAAQCWRSCCCTTPQERLAWARQRGIEPPSTLALLVALRRPTGGSAKRSCCAHKANAECAAEAKESQPSEGGSREVVSISAWRTCHGLPSVWSFHGAVLAPPAALNYEFDWRPTGWLALGASPVAWAASSPAVPPPRA